MIFFSGFGDRLCDVGRFSEALCSYGRAFDAKSADQEVGHESFVYFLQVMSKLVESKAAEFQSRRKKESIGQNGSRSTRPSANIDDLDDEENAENAELRAEDIINQRKYYEALIGEPCDDPFSCPSCSGVLNDPVTLPCGHTFCRQHVMSNTTNSSLCVKVSFNN